MQEPLRFQPLCDSAVERWSRPARFDFLDRLPSVPIADTELLHLSHYCPVMISLTEDGPRVVILLDATMLLSEPINANGRWRAPYMPIALRSLPFWVGASAADIVIAPELAVQEGHEDFALRDAAGKPSEQFAAVNAWIDRLRQGMVRLTEAAKLLVAADVLTPLLINKPGIPAPVETGFCTVSPEKFHALDGVRAAALSVDKCLPLDLAAACLFSRRLLARRVMLQKIEAAEAQVPAENRRADIVEPLDLHVQLDNSSLFSFEVFAQFGTPAQPEAVQHAGA